MSVKENNKFKLSSLIHADNILVVSQLTTKNELIKQLVDRVCDLNPGLDGADILAQVLKREEGISTTLDTGLSIPHARLEEIDDFKAALAVIPGAVEDPSNPDLKIEAMFLFLSPAKQIFFQKHLMILATLAETFKAAFIEEISQLKSPADIAALIASE